MKFIQFVFSKRFLLHVGLSVVLAFALIYGVLRFLDHYTLHGQTITVPDLSGLRIAEVEEVLTQKGLKFAVVDSLYEPTQPKGAVMGQDPKPEYQVKQNRTIYLTINSYHPPRVAMPRLIDHSIRSATIILENLGLRKGNIIYQPDQCKDCVLKQQIDNKDIKAGELVVKGAAIDLVLGMGLSDEVARVPLLINLTKDSALKVLQDHYLNLGAEIYDTAWVLTAEDSMKARVYEQSPMHDVNSILPLGSSVNIWLTTDSSKIDTNLRSVFVNDSLNQMINNDEFTSP
jgi:beta-lactam-binding protein with PASTA domain